MKREKKRTKKREKKREKKSRDAIRRFSTDVMRQGALHW